LGISFDLGKGSPAEKLDQGQEPGSAGGDQDDRRNILTMLGVFPLF
jgi:hypothetical protein